MTTLITLQAGLLQHSFTQGCVIQIWVAEQLRNQIPEVIDKVLIQGLGWEAGTADAHCLEHTTTAQLMQDIGVLKQQRPVPQSKQSLKSS